MCSTEWKSQHEAAERTGSMPSVALPKVNTISMELSSFSHQETQSLGGTSKYYLQEYRRAFLSLRIANLESITVGDCPTFT